MADQWKSTPTYWCKYCATYIRDTKLERTNHDASSKHQFAVKRFLRTLHRKHEQEERDKQAARREIARVTGVRESDLEGSSASASSSTAARRAGADKPAAPTEQQLQKQREQLAELGVAVPGDFRPEMAMPGEWTVTKIIERKIETPTTDDDQDNKMEASAVGTRKREAPEDQKEVEEALKGLFKKPKRWGRDSKAMPSEEDEELDALLNGSTFLPVKSEREETVKKEEPEDDMANVKTEEHTPNDGPTDDVKPKTEILEDAPVKPEPEDGDSGIQPIVFKKRKPKGIRQK